MTFYKDLLQEKAKSKARTIIGLFTIAISIAYILLDLKKDFIEEPYPWIWIGYFIFFGLAHTLGGMGYPIERFLGKRFILIDDKTITIKHHIFKKEKSVLWDNIQSIDIKSNRFDFYYGENQVFTVPYTNLQYSWIQDIKTTTFEIAEQKGIQIEGAK